MSYAHLSKAPRSRENPFFFRLLGPLKSGPAFWLCKKKKKKVTIFQQNKKRSTINSNSTTSFFFIFLLWIFRIPKQKKMKMHFFSFVCGRPAVNRNILAFDWWYSRPVPKSPKFAVCFIIFICLLHVDSACLYLTDVSLLVFCVYSSIVSDETFFCCLNFFLFFFREYFFDVFAADFLTRRIVSLLFRRRSASTKRHSDV